eukprot:TRINITY_DN815_c0_g2_i1.p1 TRINITY_DN815_c0_g2~~TRINITY_DN815_c0_g2_i1.p1  ORF type:complete len:192 (-),score=41.08 TRINITY_DN815_c0_g2_i1:394-969(-)
MCIRDRSTGSSRDEVMAHRAALWVLGALLALGCAKEPSEGAVTLEGGEQSRGAEVYTTDKLSFGQSYAPDGIHALAEGDSVATDLKSNQTNGTNHHESGGMDYLKPMSQQAMEGAVRAEQRVLRHRVALMHYRIKSEQRRLRGKLPEPVYIPDFEQLANKYTDQVGAELDRVVGTLHVDKGVSDKPSEMGD